MIILFMGNIDIPFLLIIILVLAIPGFFISRFILRRVYKSVTKQNLLLLSIAGGLIFSVILLIILILILLYVTSASMRV